ncbi:MAG: hypothetical protein UR62_C0004G0021 [Candidatus Nomurabacteria bacterium GW2011_GWF2_35_12]|uniref:Uncharacterized protein n=3 Tax=Candidatus Nomuraibacteriota TaxID=1752729 RepID=A0A0G0EBA0_9BACT|nr:MAG: hypothetical protein UR62_C0004G0021 [Candidatus Nomurabacteria bacterium GW2011_GWF2_35_12]KKP72934.1 MAG: hypothetical protein UR70_C0002G0003 [Candidatus Nomurabacteria bacterium GW2011_GWB1_35_20]KKP75554.1 MAG: hypothetical protein UR72_C0004G0012 [Parcubacteria group bacterium GW2011_GWC1_35_21]KKP78634.1 MAG: hypothetical protein UR77_C0001G0020 [Candidatus Nomurabacteria bacterium GW2011_GWC2_35_35]KKP85062.1 MAG: hypothetical protein UR86_C0014G0008 [Parcubacteria group bacteri
MQENGPEKLSPEAKLIALGVSEKIATDKIARLKNSPDLVALKTNVRRTSLSIPQFLSFLFKNLYQQKQVKQRVIERLQEFNLTSKMTDYMFIYGAGEPFLLFFNEYKNIIPKEKEDKFVETVNDIMLQELRAYLF